MESLIATIIFLVCLVVLVTDVIQLFILAVGLFGLGENGVLSKLVRSLPWFVKMPILVVLLGFPTVLGYVMTRCWPLM